MAPSMCCLPGPRIGSLLIKKTWVAVVLHKSVQAERKDYFVLANTTGPSNQDEKSDSGKNQVSPPSISLPNGGGAIRGIGEKFAANPVTGTGSMTVPIATSPGRSGFGPQLALSYDSGAGNGPFGFGWHLSLPAISRRTDKGLPQYDDGEEI